MSTPAAGGSVSNDAVTVTAIVTDNIGVRSVRAYLGSAGPVAAVLNTNNNIWTATLTNVPPGTNAFEWTGALAEPARFASEGGSSMASAAKPARQNPPPLRPVKNRALTKKAD